MPRAGGVYTLPAGNPVVTLTVIASNWANNTMSDIATALTGSLPTDGSAPLTGPLRAADGAVGAPGLTWATETTSGWYRIGANQFGFSVGANLSLSVNANRGWTIAAPVAGTALIVKSIAATSAIDIWSGSANSDALIQGFNSTGATRTGYLDFISGNAGIGGATEVIVVGIAATANDFVTLASGSVRRLQINGVGNVTINAPSSGTALSVAGTIQTTAGGFDGRFGSGGSYPIIGSFGATAFSLYSNSAERVVLSSSGNVTVAAPTNGVALSATAFAGNPALLLSGASGASGLQIAAGTLSTDQPLRVSSAGAAANFLQIFGDGHGFIGANGTNNLSWNTAGAFSIAAPTSGVALALTGVGGATATLTVDGLNAFQTGTFTATYVNGSNATGTAQYRVSGNLVTIVWPATFGAGSGGAALTISGIPAALQPARAQSVSIGNGVVLNNGVTTNLDTYIMNFAAASGTVTIQVNAGGTVFGGAGNRGFTIPFVSTYMLN